MPGGWSGSRGRGPRAGRVSRPRVRGRWRRLCAWQITRACDPSPRTPPQPPGRLDGTHPGARTLPALPQRPDSEGHQRLCCPASASKVLYPLKPIPHRTSRPTPIAAGGPRTLTSRPADVLPSDQHHPAARIQRQTRPGPALRRHRPGADLLPAQKQHSRGYSLPGTPPTQSRTSRNTKNSAEMAIDHLRRVITPLDEPTTVGAPWCTCS